MLAGSIVGCGRLCYEGLWRRFDILGRRIEVVYVRIGACPTNVATKSSRQDQIAAVDPSFCYQREMDVRILS